MPDQVSSDRAAPALLLSLLVVLVGLPGAPRPTAHADFNPFKVVTDAADRGMNWAGKRFGSFLGSTTEPVVSNAEEAGRRLIADADDRFGKRVAQLDATLAKSVADVDSRLERRIVQVDDVMRQRIDQVDQVLAKRVTQLSEDMQKNILKVDTALGKRIDQVDVILARRIDQVDGVLGRNIDRLDAVTEARVGNLDVVAAKTTLAAESAASRLLLLGCLVVFAAVAVWWAYSVGLARWWAATDAGGTFSQRLGRWWVTSWAALIGQVGGAAVSLLVIYGVYTLLAGGPGREFRAMLANHEAAYESSVQLLDIRKAEYHAGQLQLLAPADPAYRAMAVKAGVLRDAFLRPDARGSVVGLRSIQERLDAAEEMGRQVGVTDLDLNVIRAFLIWQVGSTRAEEYQAAVLCADALARRPIGGERKICLTFAPLAANYLESYLFLAPSDTAVKAAMKDKLPKDELPPHFVGKGVWPTNDELAKVLTEARPPANTTSVANLHPLDLATHAERLTNPKAKVSIAPVTALSHLPEYNWLARGAVRGAAIHYPLMVESYLKATLVTKDWTDKTKYRVTIDQQPALLADRAKAAKAVLETWHTFDRSLDRNPLLVGTSAPATALTLNDSSYTRARWFTEWTLNGAKQLPAADQGAGSAVSVPPTLAAAFPSPISPPAANATPPAVDDPTNADKRAWLAPPRVFWSQRYLADLSAPARHLADYEAHRLFTANEQALIEFEKKYEAFLSKLLTKGDVAVITNLAKELARDSYRLGLMAAAVPGGESRKAGGDRPTKGEDRPYAYYIQEQLEELIGADTGRDFAPVHEEMYPVTLERRVRFL